MKSNAAPKRRPHATHDMMSRWMKAQKIERLLDLQGRSQPIRLLEIGTGAGGIAHYFAHHASLHCEVAAVDVTDQRILPDGYSFHLVTDTTLPFHESYFDVVISNHVIEHVGDEAAQLDHLIEIRRVMQPEGIAYLAVPNRWMLIEPHYQLAFLSWLPQAWRSPYLRLRGRGSDYDCAPPTLSRLESMLIHAQLTFENISTLGLHTTLDIEGGGLLAAAISQLPDALLNRLAYLNPTLIYRLRRP
ncbi:class I SAM-dependent methyltransferase [Acidihalobacter aeolianus]|uniref:class I SAM-dependent methyltransferase n=1 Tax=Acidihalobacter aeolianus TaxID=2792603 RepID=UPI0009F38ED6|nr:methyltransferase domain-containing protein [Acidihalobacter aeolianus]